MIHVPVAHGQSVPGCQTARYHLPVAEHTQPEPATPFQNDADLAWARGLVINHGLADWS